jgi:hypothetical protein
MTQNKAEIPTTDVDVDLTNDSVVLIFKHQFAHLDSGELRAALEDYYGEGRVWNNEELLQSFEVSHFEPPYVHVIDKTNSFRGTVLFNDEPRLYFAYKPSKTQP